MTHRLLSLVSYLYHRGLLCARDWVYSDRYGKATRAWRDVLLCPSYIVLQHIRLEL